MDTFIPFQSVVTLSINGTGEIIQSRNGHLDLGEASSALVRVEILNMDDGATPPGHDATLFLETAVSEDGPWFPVDQWTPADFQPVVSPPGPAPDGPLPYEMTLQLATYYSAQNLLARFLRWRFTSSATAPASGRATFRMRYQLP